MEAPCTVLKLSKAEAEARGRELLARVGLGDKLNHYPDLGPDPLTRDEVDTLLLRLLRKDDAHADD